mmetsp:Transcript_4929/g.21094  ORF Transcript_4929/g.21094 Transcript_4929/m.21094 type:complete len:201 (+) Transcript_4929:1159-1761(+)
MPRALHSSLGNTGTPFRCSSLRLSGHEEAGGTSRCPAHRAVPTAAGRTLDANRDRPVSRVGSEETRRPHSRSGTARSRSTATYAVGMWSRIAREDTGMSPKSSAETSRSSSDSGVPGLPTSTTFPGKNSREAVCSPAGAGQLTLSWSPPTWSRAAASRPPVRAPILAASASDRASAPWAWASSPLSSSRWRLRASATCRK